MSNNQPIWKFVANLGDASPIDHGGLFVYEDETGVYPPEVEFLDAPEEEDDNRVWTVYRFVLEPCSFTNGILSDNEFHPKFPVWFADNIEGIASACGIEASSLIADFCGNDVLAKARAWESVGRVKGFLNLDESPLEFTDRAEVEKRYKDLNI